MFGVLGFDLVHSTAVADEFIHGSIFLWYYFIGNDVIFS